METPSGSPPAEGGRRQMRLSVKLAGLSAALTAAVVFVTFIVLSGQIRARTRGLFIDEMGRTRSALVQVQEHNLAQLLAGAKIISKSTSLIAAVKTAQVENPSQSLRQELATTYEIELSKLVRDFKTDLIVVTDEHGRIFAVSSRDSVQAPRHDADLSKMPAVQFALDPNAPADTGSLAVLREGSVLYQVGVYPIVQGDYTAGAVLVGKRLDDRFVEAARQLSGGDVVVLAGDEVVAGTRRSLSPTDVATLKASPMRKDSTATITLGQEELAIAGLPLGLTQTGVPVRLWMLQPFGGTVNDITRGLFLVFALSGAAVVVLSGLGAGFVAGSVMRPFNRFVDYMGMGTASDRLATRFDDAQASPELKTLNRSFNRLMDSLASERRQLERKTTELIAANAGLREEVRERERVEGALRQSEAQLRQSQKLEAIGTLAGGIAHDFNNLLTVISGYSQLALSRTDKTGPASDDLRQVIEAAERAARLTQQLLAFSRKQVLQPTVLELGDVVEGVVPMLRPLIGEQIELRIERADSFARIFADRGQLEQVLINLVVNARDAMPLRGVLTIRSAEVPATNGDRGGVRLEVADTGGGIPPEIRDRIFEPFFTTKAPGKGTGLGLSTVYGIVKQSGGTVTVDSNTTGTTIAITLPSADEMTPSGSIWSTDAEAPRGSETILIVEDENEVRTLARRTLEEQGYTVIAVGDPEEALQIFATATIDLVLTDVVMPRMNGPEMVARILGNGSTPGIVYMSGYADEALSGFALDEGCVFLRKPFSPLTLARTIRGALDTPWSSGVSR